MFFLSIFAKLFDRKSEVVTMTDEEITRILPNGESESVRFDDLIEVSIVTTDQGPFVEDLFYVLRGHNGAAIIGLDWACRLNLLGKIAPLPKFDLEETIRASSSCENNVFVLWSEEWLKK
jgi:hypothetical protein